MSQSGEQGNFQAIKQAQSQDQPGFEKALKPSSESTALEGASGFKEYTPAKKLNGKKALITGGDSGIGRAVAVVFAREGADISIVFLAEEQEDAEDTKRMVEEEGKRCLLFPGDLMDNHTCRKAVECHVNEYERIDVLVNNASKQILCDNFSEIDLDKVESTFRSNILQMFAVTKYALPHMRKGSSIINTSSTTAFKGSKDLVDYSASKGAIASFTRSLALQLVSKGIRVNCVAPGPVHTPIQPASRPAEQMEEFSADSKLGRPGQPSEIAPSFVFLACKDAELYYGQILHAHPLGD